MNDTISRQDALDCLTGDITDMTVEEYITRTMGRIMALPSMDPVPYKEADDE